MHYFWNDDGENVMIFRKFLFATFYIKKVKIVMYEESKKFCDVCLLQDCGWQT